MIGCIAQILGQNSQSANTTQGRDRTLRLEAFVGVPPFNPKITGVSFTDAMSKLTSQSEGN